MTRARSAVKAALIVIFLLMNSWPSERQDFSLDALAKSEAFLLVLRREYIQTIYSQKMTLEKIFVFVGLNKCDEVFLFEFLSIFLIDFYSLDSFLSGSLSFLDCADERWHSYETLQKACDLSSWR